MEDEIFEKWRKLLEEAKPEGWKWEPPETLSHTVEPKEPPDEVKEKLGNVILSLPLYEREILQTRYVAGFTQEDIASILEKEPLYVALIEKRAIAVSYTHLTLPTKRIV